MNCKSSILAFIYPLDATLLFNLHLIKYMKFFRGGLGNGDRDNKKISEMIIESIDLWKLWSSKS